MKICKKNKTGIRIKENRNLQQKIVYLEGTVYLLSSAERHLLSHITNLNP